jgi:hypothetical protein
MTRPLHCNVFTTLSEKQYPLFVIGATKVLNSMPQGGYLYKGKLKRSLEILKKKSKKSTKKYWRVFPGYF